jgi:hypothetical protein
MHTKITKDADIRAQVQDAMDGSVGSYDGDAITAEIIARFGLVDVDTIDQDLFWNIVASHAYE